MYVHISLVRNLSPCRGGDLQYPGPHGPQPGHEGGGGRQQRSRARLHHLPRGCPQDDWRLSLGHHFLLHVGGQYTYSNQLMFL